MLAADSGELLVRNEQHVPAAVDVVNLEQLRPLAALTGTNLNGAAVAVAGPAESHHSAKILLLGS